MNLLTLAWTVVTGVAAVALVAIGWAIYQTMQQQLGVQADAATSLRKVVHDLNQARMTDELWQAVDRVAGNGRADG